MTIRISRFVFPLIALLESAASPQTSDSEITARIIESVARYAYERGTYTSSRDTLTSGIKVDPTVMLQTGRLFPSAESGRAHAEAVTVRLRSVPGVSVVSAERAAECGAYAPTNCMDNGRSIVLRFAAPTITGDSAFVDIHVRVSVAVSAADSAAFARSGSPMAMSLRRAAAGVDRAFVKKVDGSWVVQRIITIAQT